MRVKQYFTVLRLIALLFLCLIISSSCASYRDIENPFPALYFSNIKQIPRTIRAGHKAQIEIHVSNKGGRKSFPSLISVKFANGKILLEKRISSIYPETSLKFIVDLPPSSVNYRLVLEIDPERKNYEKNRSDNKMVYDVLVQQPQEALKIDKKSKTEFDRIMKKNNADYCRSKIILKKLKRIDREMNYELAREGEDVRFEAEIENRCREDVYDLRLRWVVSDSEYVDANEKIFGQFTINRLGSGEKRVFQRTLSPREGRWTVSLQLFSVHASGEKTIVLHPKFILIVNE
jgi:predicted transcriptional regulator